MVFESFDLTTEQSGRFHTGTNSANVLAFDYSNGMNISPSESDFMETDSKLSEQIEETIRMLETHNDQPTITRLVKLFRECIEQGLSFLVPLSTQPESDDLLEIPKLNLEQITTGTQPKFRKVEMSKGGLAYCAFTSPGEMNLGPVTENEMVPAEKLFTIALEDDAAMGLIFNPWSLSILLNKELLSLILKGSDDEEDPTSKGSLYIDHSESCEQDCDVIVSVGQSPFDFNEPSSTALLKAAGPRLEEACFKMQRPEPGQIAITEAPNLKAKRIFHVALPQELNERTLTTLISSILSLADEIGARSIALPAIGSEDGNVDPDVPFAVIVTAGWFNAHPESNLSVTITCRSMDTYKEFIGFLFD